MINTYTSLANTSIASPDSDYLYRIIMNDDGRTVTLSYEAESLLAENNIYISEKAILSGLVSLIDQQPISVDLFQSSSTGENDIHLSLTIANNILVRFINKTGKIYRQKLIDTIHKTISIANLEALDNFYEQLNQQINN